MLYDHLFIGIINKTWIRSFSNREFVWCIGAAKFIIINLLSLGTNFKVSLRLRRNYSKRATSEKFYSFPCDYSSLPPAISRFIHLSVTMYRLLDRKDFSGFSA